MCQHFVESSSYKCGVELPREEIKLEDEVWQNVGEITNAILAETRIEEADVDACYWYSSGQIQCLDLLFL